MFNATKPERIVQKISRMFLLKSLAFLAKWLYVYSMLEARKKEIHIEINAKVGLAKFCKTLDKIIAKNKSKKVAK